MGSHHSSHSQATKNGDESSDESASSQGEGSGGEEDNAEADKGKTEALSDEKEVSKSEDKQEHPHTQDTLTSVSQLFGKHEDTDPKSDSEEKVQTAQKRQRKDSPKKGFSESSSSEEELPTDKGTLQ